MGNEREREKRVSNWATGSCRVLKVMINPQSIN